MNFFKKNQTVLIAIGIIVAGFIAYFFFFQNNNQGALVTTTNPSVSAANQEFVALFSKLRRIDLDTSIFEDEYYSSLVDFSRPIAEEPVGRDNPFASAQ
ncbi:MAG: hypothetical protein ACJKSS_00105 [Patescibacteria group bacterium UBA2103]